MQTLFERLLKGVVSVLNDSSQEEEKHFIEKLEELDAEMAEEIKNRMFIFDDIALLDDRATQKWLREVETEEIAKALRGAMAEAQDKVYRNMSKRAVELLKEEMEAMGPVRRGDVEENQQKIASIIRKLENQGEIVVARSGSDEMVV